MKGKISLSSVGRFNTTSKIRALKFLEDNEGIRAVDVARGIGASRQSIHYILVELTNNGLIRRTGNGFWITAHGKKALK